MIKYNYSQEPLLMKEYGRNIQNIVRYISQMEDKAIQKRNIEAMIKVMKLLNQNIKNNEDNMQKIWDHLVLISDFKLGDVSPYPLPSKDNIFQKPSPNVTYPKYDTKQLHFGRYLENVTKKCLEETDPKTQKEYMKYMLNYIRLVQINEAKDVVSQESIKRDFNKLTQYQFDALPFIDEYIVYIDSSIPKFTPRQQNSNRKPFGNAGRNGNANRKRNNRHHR